MSEHINITRSYESWESEVIEGTKNGAWEEVRKKREAAISVSIDGSPEEVQPYIDAIRKVAYDRGLFR